MKVWKPNNQIPKAYPQASEWESIPGEIRTSLDGVLNLDVVIGLDIKSELQTRFFVNYHHQEHFYGLLSAYTTDHKYIPTAPRPQWQLPSHFIKFGMREDSALKASLIYRAEAELLFFDLLNIGQNRTNENTVKLA